MAAAVLSCLSCLFLPSGPSAAAGRPAEPTMSSALTGLSELGRPDSAAVVPLARDPTGSGAAPAAPWGWPLTPLPTVLARFDPPAQAWSAGHRGVDLAAAVGQDVLAPSAGVVSFAGVIAGRGVLVVSAASGLRSTLEPVDGIVPVGTPVQRGQPVGHVSAVAGHCAPATCVHWGVLRDTVYLDPLAMVGLSRVVLLPLR